MTQLADSGIGDLRRTMGGPVLGPHDPGYDDARRLWNAAIDGHPAVIARCQSAADVCRAVLLTCSWSQSNTRSLRNGAAAAVQVAGSSASIGSSWA